LAPISWSGARLTISSKKSKTRPTAPEMGISWLYGDHIRHFACFDWADRRRPGVALP
jgi:hypothetical protein